MLLGAPRQIGRLVSHMTNLRQDRVPGPTLSPTSANPSGGSAVNGRPGSPGSVVLSLRLRTTDSSGASADVSWSPSAVAHSPAAALCFDVLAASGGALDPAPDGTLTARFSNLQSALLAARRLQWAIEGLADAGSTVSVGVAIQSLESQDAAEVLPSPDTATPGARVWVNSTIAEAVQQLPGSILSNASEGNWREVQWRAPGTPSNLAADEQAVLSLIQALGRKDPCVAQPEQPEAVPHVPAPATTGVHPAPGLGRSHVESARAFGLGKRKWLILGGAAVVVVLAAILVIPAMVSGGHSKVPAQTTDTSRPVPANSSNALPAAETPAATDKAHDQSGSSGEALQKPPAKTSKPPKWEPKSESKIEPQPALKPSGSCELTEAEIPRSLARAENLMYAGKLDDAQDAFQHLLGCPSAHEKAAAGLQRVKQRMATQGLSGP